MCVYKFIYIHVLFVYVYIFFFFTIDMCIYIYSILCDDLGRIRNQVHPGPDQLHMARKA